MPRRGKPRKPRKGNRGLNPQLVPTTTPPAHHSHWPQQPLARYDNLMKMSYADAVTRGGVAGCVAQPPAPLLVPDPSSDLDESAGPTSDLDDIHAEDESKGSAAEPTSDYDDGADECKVSAEELIRLHIIAYIPELELSAKQTLRVASSLTRFSERSKHTTQMLPLEQARYLFHGTMEVPPGIDAVEYVLRGMDGSCTSLIHMCGCVCARARIPDSSYS